MTDYGIIVISKVNNRSLIMQLSESTLSVLKNFSTINPNLVFKQGNQIKTISVAKNILATATITETFRKSLVSMT